MKSWTVFNAPSSSSAKRLNPDRVCFYAVALAKPLPFQFRLNHHFIHYNSKKKTQFVCIWQVNSLGDSHHYSMYDAWRQGDTALNWDGSEDNQGYFLDEPPFGTPLAWTSNRQSSGEAYQKLNK